MYKWQPGKWAKFAAVGAGLPFVAGAWLNTDSMESDIKARATAAAGEWANVQINGRDAVVAGTAPNQEAVDAAVKAVVHTYGVRLVDVAGIKVEEPKAAEPAPVAEVIAAPTVTSATLDGGIPLVTGTWAEGKAKELNVKLADVTYSLGKNPELTSAAGNWQLKLAAALPPGNYPVVVSDGVTAATADDKLVALTVEAPKAAEPTPAVEAPAVPTVATADLSATPPMATGTWAEGKATGLEVSVNKDVYALGKNPELTSAAGNWTLTLPEALPAGDYAVSVAQVVDGKPVTVAAPTAVAVAAPAAAPAPVAAPAPEPVPMKAPKLDPVVVEAGKPVTLTGTWSAGTAKNLSVALNGTPAVLGKDFNLLSDTSGKWKLNLGDLAPGHYDVLVKSGDDNIMLRAETGFDIAAAAAAAAPAVEPAAPVGLLGPTVDSSTSEADRPTVTGTWTFVPGHKLQVELDGVTHTLGKDYDLLSDTSGKWKLTPAKPVINGTYDVIAKVTALDGTSVVDVTKGEVTVNVAAPPADAPAAGQPYDCEGTLAKIAASFPVRFDTDKSNLTDRYQTSLSLYGALLSDPRCAGLKVHIEGFADERGGELYNQALSERRATSVLQSLVGSKIDAARLTSGGSGKQKPLDPEHTEDAHAKNRRVEISIEK